MWSATVGLANVTRIVAYTENGQMAEVPWFAVYSGPHLTKRINAAHVVEVLYQIKDD